MEKKISLITVCSNRLHHLRQTLPCNIKDNADWSNLEFIVLDYSSTDGLEDWISADMGYLVEMGKLKYFRMLKDRMYHQSHSRNLAFSLATGDILCNINADHFTGPSFARYVAQVFSSDENVVITPIDFFSTQNDYYVPGDLFGLCCVKMGDFNKISGFDESMNNYGFEDVDFINRLEMAGVKRFFLPDIYKYKFISHGKNERYPLTHMLKAVKRIFVSYINPAESEWIILYSNGLYGRFLLVDKFATESVFFVNGYTSNHNRYRLYLRDTEHPGGGWTESDSRTLELRPDESCVRIHLVANQLGEFDDTSSARAYFEVLGEATFNKIVEIKYTFHSRYIMELNLKHRVIVPNRQGYGKGEVRGLTN